MRFGATNGSSKTGDYIRILVKPTSGSSRAIVEEDGSVSVSNGGSASSPDPVTVDSGSTLSSSTRPQEEWLLAMMGPSYLF